MKSIVIACLACLSMTAHAEFKTGNQLLSELTGNFGEQMNALGYITGAADVLMGLTFCPPLNITAGQLNDMMKQYLQQYPSERHNTADRIINHVLKSAWPCAQKKSGSSL